MVSRADKDSTGCISEDDFLEAFDWLMEQGQDERDYMAIFNMLVRASNATTLEVLVLPPFVSGKATLYYIKHTNLGSFRRPYVSVPNRPFLQPLFLTSPYRTDYMCIVRQE